MTTTQADRIPGDLDPGAIGRTLDDLAEIGSRFHGTSGEIAGRDYVLGRFKEIGLDRVRLEPFPYLAYEALAATCRLVTPEPADLVCKPLQYTVADEVEAEAVYVGSGGPTDIARLDRIGVDLAGRIAVAHTQHPFREAPLLRQRGIAGLVVISEAPEDIIPHYGADFSPLEFAPPWGGRPLPFPGVTVGASTGRRLVSTMTAGVPVTLRVEHRARYVEREAHNVLGEIAGETDEQVLAGAHYDTQDGVPGVWDNGSGVASLIALATANADKRLARGLVFVAFAVEEAGLWGSSAYTVAHAAELSRLAGMVNFDAVASTYPGKRQMFTNERMRALAVETATEQGWPPEMIVDPTGRRGSDHAPFSEAGIPVCYLLDYPSYAHPCYHTLDDTREIVDEHKVARVAGVSSAIVHRLATMLPS